MTHLLAPGEPGAFEILNPGAQSAWVITCDHAANRVPEMLGKLGVTDADLARHIGWDIGAAAVTRGLAARLGAWSILQNYSRLVIDCNRFPGHETSIPTISEHTEIPGNRYVGDDEAARRREEIFDPYHAAIAAHLDERAADGRPTLLVTMHSYTPIYAGQARFIHSGVLYNHDSRLALALLRHLRAEPGLEVGDNAPYSATDNSDYGVNVHGERRGIPYVEIEIRQDLIEHEAGQNEWIERLARLLPLAAQDAGFGK